jgi:hypothetical protein
LWSDNFQTEDIVVLLQHQVKQPLKTGAGDDEQITINCQAFSGFAVKSNASTKDGIPADLPATAKSEAAKRRVSSTSPTKLDEKQKP